MFPAQAATHVIQPVPWRFELRMRGKQVATNKHLTSFSPFLPVCVSLPLLCDLEEAKTHWNLAVWSPFGRLGWIRGAKQKEDFTQKY